MTEHREVRFQGHELPERSLDVDRSLEGVGFTSP